MDRCIKKERCYGEFCSDKEGLVRNVKLRDIVFYRVCKMVEFEILRAAKRLHSKLTTLECRRADFSLFLV